MKIILTILSAYIFTQSLIAQTTNIPDANFEQALIDNELDNELDGVILTSNIVSVTHLDIPDMSIQDLTGIEDFQSLFYLVCLAHQISEETCHKHLIFNSGLPLWFGINLFKDLKQMIIFLNFPSDSIVTMAHPVSLKIPPKKKYSSFK